MGWGFLQHIVQGDKKAGGGVGGFLGGKSFYSPQNVVGGVKQGVTDTAKGIVKSAVATAKLPADLAVDTGARFSSNKAFKQNAADQLNEHAQMSFLGPLAQVAHIGGTNLAANKLLSNKTTSPEVKQAQLSEAVNPSYNEASYDLADKGARLKLKEANTFAQAALTPVLSKGGGEALAKYGPKAVEVGASKAASVVKNAEVDSTPTPGRVLLETRRTMNDAADHIDPAKKFTADPAETARLMKTVRTIGDRFGKTNEFVNGTRAERATAIRNWVKEYDTNRKTFNETGAVGKDVNASDHLDELAKAETPKEVKKIIGQNLPEPIADNVAPAIAKTNDPHIISEIINRETPQDPNLPPTRTVAPPPQEVVPTTQPSPEAVQASIPPPTAGDALAGHLDTAQKLRNSQEELYAQERSKRIGTSQAVGKDLQGSEGYKAELAQLKGELPKEDYKGIGEHLSSAEKEQQFTELRNQIKEHPELQGYAGINAQGAVRKVLFGEGGVPTNSEIKLLEKLSPKLAETVKEDVAQHNEKLNAIKSFGSTAAEVVGVPRALMASVDFSAGLRQGLAAATRHPAIFAKEFVKQFKSFASEEAYRKNLDAIESHPNFPLMKQAKLAIQDVGSHRPNEHEEQFVSSLAEKIPGLGKLVHASNRAYTGLLSNMRANIFNQLAETAKNAGLDLNDTANAKLLRNIGEVVNTSTGRGSLGRFEAAGHAASTALFAPRLIASRIQTLNPHYYIKLEPIARKEALTTLISLGAFGTTVLGLAKAAGLQVSTDPTNADFGKIKKGDTRFDVLGGFQQYIRLGAELKEGKITSSTTGGVVTLGDGFGKPTRLDILTNFAQNKEAPIPSFITTLLKGKDASGKPLNITKEVRDRFIPLIAQDITDLLTHKDSAGVGAAVPALFGVGVQTYGAQDQGISDKQKGYIDAKKKSGALEEEIKADTLFFQYLKGATGTRQNTSDSINAAIKARDLDKARKLAEEYNKKVAQGLTKWADQYGDKYGNSDLQKAYNDKKIKLTGENIKSRIKALQDATKGKL